MHISKKKIALCALGIIILLLIGLLVFWQYLPYQNIAGRQVIKFLKGHNIDIGSLKIDQISNVKAEISDIQLGQKPDSSIEKLTLKYNSLQNLANGKITDIEAENIGIILYKKDQKFTISGLEDFLNNPNPKPSNSNIIFTDKNSLQQYLPENISIKKLNISADEEDLALDMNLNLDLGLQHEPIFTMDSPGIKLAIKQYNLATNQINLSANLQGSKWQGQLTSEEVKITGTKRDLPPFLTKIIFELSQDNLLAHVLMHDDGNLIKIDLNATLPLKNPMGGILDIKHIQFPWGDGLIATDAVKVPLNLKEPIAFTVKLQNVDLSEILNEITNEKVKATGIISGTFPVIYNPDGTFILKDGMAEHVKSGTISVAPELLPGDNAQLQLARTTLANFHYTKLKILVSSSGEKSAITLILEGRNPDASEERPVKFTINLTGDIMPLVQQSLIPFNDLKTLIKQGNQ